MGFPLEDRWPLLAMPRREGILSGFVFEHIRESYAVSVFVMPLYIPSPHIWLTHGHRLREENIEMRLSLKEWAEHLPMHLTDPTVAEILRISTAAELIQWLMKDPHPESFSWQQSLAYSLVLVQQVKQAVLELKKVIHHEQLVFGRDWEQKTKRDASILLEDISDGVLRAKLRLHEWQAYTVHELELE